jgi:urease accessory protein
MIRATQVKPHHHWSESPADTVVLDFDDRHRRRMAMTATRGLEFLLDLENAVALRGGDALVLEDGRLVEVVAAPEPLIEARASDVSALARLGWHLGDRHIPVQVLPNRIRTQRTEAIEILLASLGAKVVVIDAPFEPEGGAYASSHAQDDHAHDRHHGHHHD